MPFDILEIQKTIEEKRLVLGQKFEKFLLGGIKNIIGYFLNILRCFFAQKYSVFVVCFFIILSSIFIRSTRDIGHESAFNIAVAQHFVDGGFGLSLASYFTILPVFLAKFFSISAIIALEIFVNLIGVLSILFSAIILRNAYKIYSRGQIQLLIICFCVGYFLRIYALQFGEYGTQTSYFLALAFPYFSYQISRKNSVFAQLISGLLAGLMVCINPFYAMLPLVFEAEKFRSTKNIRSVFSWQNFISLFLVLGYFSLFSPQFGQNFAINNEYIIAIKNDIFPLLLLAIVVLPYVLSQTIFKPLFCCTIAASLIVIAQMDAGYDQRAIFFSLSLSLLTMMMFFLLQKNLINFKKDALLILIILLLPQFDAQNFFALALNSCYFWWIILFFDKKADRCLFVFAFITIILMIFDKSGQVAWLFSALIFITLFKPKISILAKKNGPVLYLSKPSIILVSLVISYFISLFLATVINQKNLYAQNLKSPNYLNEQKAFFINKYASNKDDEIVFIADDIAASYPILIYLDKNNSLAPLKFDFLYKNIYQTGVFRQNLASNQQFRALKGQIDKSQNKLIFVETKKYRDDQCYLGFLEYYFQDEEFKKSFTKNYVFIDEIILLKKEKIVSDLLAEASRKNILEEKEVVANVIEVYLRK